MTSADTDKIGGGEEVEVSARFPQMEVARRKLRRSWSLTALGKLEVGLPATSPVKMFTESQQRAQLRTTAATRTIMMRMRHTSSAVSILLVSGSHLIAVTDAFVQSYASRN